MTFVTLSCDYERPSIGVGKRVFAQMRGADPDFPNHSDPFCVSQMFRNGQKCPVDSEQPFRSGGGS